MIGAETYSRILDWNDRSTCVLFGDGAGAVLLQSGSEAGILSTHIHADGEFEELLHVPAGISSGYSSVRAEAAFIQMKGNEVFKKAVSQLGSIARETLANNNVDQADLDWLVPHQANMRIINAAARKLKLPMEKVVVTVDEHANTSSASIPLALDVAVRDGRIQRGELLLLEAFGAGPDLGFCTASLLSLRRFAVYCRAGNSVSAVAAAFCRDRIRIRRHSQRPTITSAAHSKAVLENPSTIKS